VRHSLVGVRSLAGAKLVAADLMYRYDDYDRTLVAERVAQFRDQTRRFLAGELPRTSSGRCACATASTSSATRPCCGSRFPTGSSPRGSCGASRTSRAATTGATATSARGRTWQYNWPRLADVPDILAELAEVDMHAIQTSGNCVRNITADHFAGIAPDEVIDPRPLAEILRQWSTFHPEFTYLPRKFKIAINGASADRTAILLHDIGLQALRGDDGETHLRVSVGGGMGRTPMIGHVIREALPWRQMLNYVEAIIRVYNRYGRRDNIWKARIKILVKALGPEEFARQVEEEWEATKDSPSIVTDAEFARVAAHFAPPAYAPLPDDDAAFSQALEDSTAFARWVQRNVHAHRQRGYAAVTLSLKKTGTPPGDINSGQMDFVADLADPLQLRGAARLARAERDPRGRAQAGALRALARGQERGLATPNVGLLTNIIAARAATSARSRTPSRSRSPRRSSAASTTSTTCTTSASSTSTSPAA
jgi:sulfite reductase (NADPH) hemoprotein beta-component